MGSDLRYRNRGNVDLLGIIDIPPGRVLDCGCGAGGNARLLRQRGWQVTGVTIDPIECAAAAAECERVELADLARGLPFAPDGGFELVVLSHVLEHLANPSALLVEVGRVLAPGGRIAVALPNVANYRQRVQFLMGRFEYTETGVMDATHLRFFTVSTARHLLERAGFSVLSHRACGGLPWGPVRRLLSESLIQRLDDLAVSARPNLVGWQTLLLAAPGGGPDGTRHGMPRPRSVPDIRSEWASDPVGAVGPKSTQAAAGRATSAK